jgi:uncharacterized protein
VSPRGLLVGVSDLLRRPGARRAVQRVIDSPGHMVGGAEVPLDAEIELDLVVEATADPNTLSLTGVVRAPWTGECRRCLDPVDGVLELQVRELFSREPDTSGDEDVWPIEAEQIDVAAVVADAILLALPLAPLCGPHCRGPAPDEFPAHVADEDLPGDSIGADEDGPAEVVVDVRDPRWSALDDLRFD